METGPEPRQDDLYKSLEANQIRLLKLNPVADDQIIGKLEVADLNSPPPYYAVSHSWADLHSYTNACIDGNYLTLGTDLLACVR